MHYGSFDVNMALLTKAINDLKWGCKNIPTLYNEIRKSSPKNTKTKSSLSQNEQHLFVKEGNVYVKLLSENITK